MGENARLEMARLWAGSVCCACQLTVISVYGTFVLDWLLSCLIFNGYDIYIG